MGIFRQVSTELWPLIDVRNWFLLSIFGISLLIFFKLGIIVGIEKDCLGIAYGYISTNKYRVMGLDLS